MTIMNPEIRVGDIIKCSSGTYCKVTRIVLGRIPIYTQYWGRWSSSIAKARQGMGDDNERYASNPIFIERESLKSMMGDLI